MITKELEPRLKPQICPLCNESQDILINGFSEVINQQGHIDPDRGYSFCNCRNIFYTDKANLDATIYSEEYSKKYEPASNSIRRYNVYIPEIQEHKSSGKVIEIGCINPALLDEFKKAGFETVGLDIIPHTFEGHGNITGDFEKFITTDKYSVIWASHIFEHFLEPIKAIEKCYTLLESGGLLFVSMPDPYCIDWSNPYMWGHWHLKEHHIMWDMDSFCDELEKAGFEIIFKKRNFGDKFICIGDYHILAKKKGITDGDLRLEKG